jgi:hypothetical protein
LGTHREGELRSTITSTTGGVMTEEVGAVTGVLEIATRTGVEDVEVAVRYAGADEWYTVEGSPIGQGRAGGSSPGKLREKHGRIVRHLTTPGKIVDGNEEPVSLQGCCP